MEQGMDAETMIREIVALRSEPKKKGQSFHTQVRDLVEQALTSGVAPERIAEAAGVKPATVLNWTSDLFRYDWNRRQRVAGLGFEPLSYVEEDAAKSARRAYKGDPRLLAVDCPQCKAPAGAGCVTTVGKEAPYPHTIRVKASGILDRFLRALNALGAFVKRLPGDSSGLRLVGDSGPVLLDDGLTVAVRDQMVVLLFRMACGHTYSQPLPDSDYGLELVMQDRYRACRECFYAEENLLAAATAAVQGWPDLEGTPKQVSWAGTIRTKLVPTVSTWMAEMDFSDAWAERFLARMLSVTNAAWWINVRDVEPWQLLRFLLDPGDFR